MPRQTKIQIIFFICTTLYFLIITNSVLANDLGIQTIGIVKTFQDAVADWDSILKTYTLRLFALLLMIDIAWIGIRFALERPQLTDLIKLHACQSVCRHKRLHLPFRSGEQLINMRFQRRSIRHHDPELFAGKLEQGFRRAIDVLSPSVHGLLQIIQRQSHQRGHLVRFGVDVPEYPGHCRQIAARSLKL